MLFLVADVANQRFLKSTGASIAHGVLSAAVASAFPPFLLIPAAAAFDLVSWRPRRGTRLRRRDWSLLLLLAVAMGAAAPVALELIPALLVFGAAAALGHARSLARRAILHARRCTDAARHARREQNRLRSQQHETTHHMVKHTRLRERDRISHALHDTVGHRLTGVLMQLQASRRLLLQPGVDPASLSDRIDTCVRQLSGTLELMRDTVHDMRPRPTSGLEQIRRTADSFAFCPVSLQIDPSVEEADRAVVDELARTVEEALTNVARHSDATEVVVRLTRDAESMQLVVRDNGSSPFNLDRREGLGLSGIRSRAERLGGSLHIERDAGFGLTVRLPADTVGAKER